MRRAGFNSRVKLFSAAVVAAIALIGPVAPASAAASSINVSNTSALASSVLGVGDTANLRACFQGTVARSGGANSDVKLRLNVRTAGVAWGGVRSSFGPGLTDNCLDFSYVVAGDDAVATPNEIKATGILLSNSAQLSVTGFDAVTASPTSISPEQVLQGGMTPMPLSLDLADPTLSSSTPADGATGVAYGNDLLLTFDERVSPTVGLVSRSCSGGTATVTTLRDHNITVGELVAPLQVGPGYDSSGLISYYRVTAVVGRNVSYSVACSNEASTITSGVLIPIRYISIAEDADTAKNLSNLAISSNVATVTSNSHGFEVGDTVMVEAAATAGGAQPQFNGAYVITAANANTFSFDTRNAAASTTANVAGAANFASTAATAGTARRVFEAIANASNKVTYPSSNVAPFSVTINPAGALPGSTAVHVRVQAGAIMDTVGRSYAGITNATSLNFGVGVAPASIVNITSSTADGSYRSGGGTNPSIQVRFNQPITVNTSSGTPSLTLNSGGAATYASGSGGKTLTFTYTIGAGHSTVVGKQRGRLNVTGLLLNGGTMTGVSMSTQVPASGTSGALNVNKNIVIDNGAPTPEGLMPFPGAVGVQATQQLLVRFPEHVVKVDNKKVFIKTLVPHVAKTITNTALASNVATITTSSAHGLVAGNTVEIAGVANDLYNGSYLVASAPTTTTFTFAKTNADVGSAAAVGTATRSVWETITIGAGNTTVTNNDSGGTVVIARAEKASTVNLVTSPETDYYVESEAGAFTDLAGNTSAAIAGSGTWAFRASPDTVAPVFNPNASDPPNGMGTFDPSRNITLTFTEAVSPVATKTIRLCTGDAGCATPVETFTLPSASVTSGSGGVQQIIDPASNLNAGTTYFLLIDAGAFADGAENVTLAATTAGQYQFTTMSMGGGGGGGTSGSCGPPPLPPCGVGPGLNFGPGGMIQNPGAIGGGDMVNLRPDNFMGFRPDDARNLGAGAMQNFRPDQFGALPPTAMAGFNRDQIANLNPAAMAGMNQTQFRALPPEAMAGFRPDQMAQLPPSAMGAFDPTRVQALPPSAMAGFNANQFAQLPPAAMAGFDPTRMQQLPPAAMAGFNANQMQQLPPAAMAGFDASKMAQLPPSAMAGFDPTKMQQLPPAAMAGFKAEQMAQLPPAAFTAFDPTKMQQLPPQAMAGFDASRMAQLPPAAVTGFKPDQFAQLPPSAMAAFDPTKMQQLPPAAVAGFQPEQMRALPPEAMRVFDPSKMQQLPPAAMAGFDPTKMQALPPTAMAVMNPNQLGQMPPAAFGAIQTQQFNVLPPTAMSGFKPELMAALPPQMVQNFKPEQFAALPPAAMGGLNEDRFRALPPQAMTAFNPQQMGAVPPQAMEAMRVAQFNVIPPTAMQGFKPDQFAALPPDAMQAFKPTQMAALPPAALAGMEPEQLRVLPPTAARALNPQQMTAVPPQALAAIPPGVFKALTPAAIAALTPEQRSAMPPQAFNPPPLPQPATAGNIGNLINSLSGWNIDKVPAAAFSGMRATDVAKLPADAFSALAPTQVGALPPTAFTAMKPNQVELLPPEAMAAMKPTQLGQLPPQALAALSPAQVGALPPAALTQMKPTQAGQLPAEAFEVMKPTQVAALPPAAMGAIKPDQVAALPPEAMTAMKPTQVAALKPTAMAALEPAQVAALPPTALTQMKPVQVAALPADALSEMKPTQVAALPPAAVGGLKPDQVAALPAEAMTSMKPPQVAALKPTAMAAIEPAQVDALPPAAFREVKPAQVGALPADAVKALDPAQINALPSAAFAGLKPEQAQQLTPEQAAQMKGPDLAAMPPAVRSIVNTLKR